MRLGKLACCELVSGSYRSPRGLFRYGAFFFFPLRSLLLCSSLFFSVFLVLFYGVPFSYSCCPKDACLLVSSPNLDTQRQATGHETALPNATLFFWFCAAFFLEFTEKKRDAGRFLKHSYGFVGGDIQVLFPLPSPTHAITANDKQWG